MTRIDLDEHAAAERFGIDGADAQRFILAIRALPDDVTLRGEPWLQELAARLTQLCPMLRVSDAGTPVTVTTRERFGVALLTAMLEDEELPLQKYLFEEVPEATVISVAASFGIQPAPDTSAVRAMLDTIARAQPQTYQSLMRSGQRLLTHTRDDGAFPHTERKIG
jgi:hypothetical protein